VQATLKLGIAILLSFAANLSGYEGTPNPHRFDKTVCNGKLIEDEKETDEKITFDDAKATSRWATELGFEAMPWVGLGEVAGNAKTDTEPARETVWFSVRGKNAAGDELVIQFIIHTTTPINLSSTYLLRTKDGKTRTLKLKVKLEPALAGK
jgi:hypothetical protein